MTGTNRKATLVLFLALAAGCQCASDIDPDAPPRFPPPERLRLTERSTVFIPVEIPIREVQALVNEAVPDSLYSVRDERIRGGIFPIRMDLDITRDGPIVTRTDSGSVENAVPIRAAGRVRVPPGIWRPFESTFTIHAQTMLTLDPDWATIAHTSGDFTWRESPYITLLGIRIGLQGKAENALRDQLRKLAPKIDGMIEEKVNLRKEADKIWDSIGEPIQLRADPPAWLLIRPVGTYFTQAVSEADTFVVGLNVEAELETILGDRPVHVLLDTLPPLTPLADTLGNVGRKGFQMHLPVTITYQQAQNLLARTLAGRPLDVRENLTVLVDSVELYPSGSTIIAQMDFSASLGDSDIGGRLYLKGVPKYDILTQTISVDSLDYDLSSRSALARAADWFFHGTFLEQTREQLRFSVADEIAVVSEQVRRVLNNRALGKHILLDAHITQFQPADIYLTEDGINVDVFVRGTMVARVRALGEAL